MGRRYAVPFTATASPAAAFDAFEVLASSAKPFYLCKVVLAQSSDYGDAAAEGLAVLIKRGVANTSGSGGSTVTPAKVGGTNDAAAGPTAEVMNTTQATSTGGSLTNIYADAFNVQGGWEYQPVPEDRFYFAAGEMCVVSVSAPADAVTMSGTLIFEEL